MTGINQKGVLRLPEDFIGSDFVAIFNRPGDADRRMKYAFENNLYFRHIRNGLIKTYGWQDKMLLIPHPKGRCRLSPSHAKHFDNERPNRCKYINTQGHHTRHMHSHLPAGVGFYKCCPACGKVARRGDMFKQHAKICAPRNGLDIEELIMNTERNTFLRLAST